MRMLIGDTRMDRSVTYVSTRCFPAIDSPSVIAAIVGPARARNARLGVTGVLVATEHHFAQSIEGPGAAIDALMRSIERDPRHTDVTVVRRSDLSQRRFARWSLAYQGRSVYFENIIRPLVGNPGAAAADVDRLVDLIARLAAPAPRPLSYGERSP